MRLRRSHDKVPRDVILHYVNQDTRLKIHTHDAAQETSIPGIQLWQLDARQR
jgi:hypothetical protein